MDFKTLKSQILCGTGGFAWPRGGPYILILNELTSFLSGENQKIVCSRYISTISELLREIFISVLGSSVSERYSSEENGRPISWLKVLCNMFLINVAHTHFQLSLIQTHLLIPLIYWISFSLSFHPLCSPPPSNSQPSTTPPQTTKPQHQNTT